MENIEDFVERIRMDIVAKCGCNVSKKRISDGYHLRGQKVFAWVRRVDHGRVVPDKCFPIQVKEKDAINAGLSDLGDKRDLNGWWDEPARYWYVVDNDPQTYKRAIKALGEICRSLC